VKNDELEVADAAIEALLRDHDPQEVSTRAFLDAQFDAGLAWVHFPPGHGGLGLSRSVQAHVAARLEERAAPSPDTGRNGIGLGMAAPTIASFGTDEQKTRFLKPIFTSAEIWCQLFSEPSAGSDLAAVGTRAVRDGDEWRVTGQKVWTSSAHNADFAILVARTDPEAPKHRGITYFLCPMRSAGVDVRPLRQLTGEAEFNEVFLDDVRVPDDYRVGEVGGGWAVANGTLSNERVAIGAVSERESGHIGIVARMWREQPEVRRVARHDHLMKLWVDAEVTRLAGERFRQLSVSGQPGPEGSALKLSFAAQAQAITGFALELDTCRAVQYGEWSMSRPELVSLTGRDAGYRYLRAKGNSIEGGTSEILRNIVSERVLGLPQEFRSDKDVPWKDLPR